MIKRSVLAVACLALATAATGSELAPADRNAAFAAAGFKRSGNQWKACDDPGTASYVAGSVEQTGDLNGDGRPEAILSESSSACYGEVEAGYFLVSKQANGSWKLITSGSGVLTVLATKGAGGWPDLEIGGPGFCFPVERWNGSEYKLLRHQYEGKACRP